MGIGESTTAAIGLYFVSPREKLVSTGGRGVLHDVAPRVRVHRSARFPIPFDKQRSKRMISVEETQYDIPVAQPSLPSYRPFQLFMTRAWTGEG